MFSFQKIRKAIMGLFDFFKRNKKTHNFACANNRSSRENMETCKWCKRQGDSSNLHHVIESNDYFCKKEECYNIFLEVSRLHNKVSQLLENNDACDYIFKFLKPKELDYKLTINYIVDSISIHEWSASIRYLLDSDRQDEIDYFMMEEITENLNSQIENAEDIDSKLQLNVYIDHAKDLTKDINMLVQLFNKNNIEVNIIHCLLAINKLMLPELREIAEPIVGPAYDAISVKTTTDKKVIVKEFLKLNNRNTLFYIKRLFDKFQISYTETELIDLENQCKNELELEKFESNLGIEKQKKIDPSFDKLNGYEFESYAKNFFQLLGYQAMNTKLSSDQGADLILSKDNIKTVVQCKQYSDPVSNKAVQEVVAAKNHYGCDEAIVICTSSFTKSAIELAKSNKVDLWDRDKIEQTINYINKQLERHI